MRSRSVGNPTFSPMPDDAPTATPSPPRYRLGHRCAIATTASCFCSRFSPSRAQQMRLTQNLYQVYEISGSAFLVGHDGARPRGADFRSRLVRRNAGGFSRSKENPPDHDLRKSLVAHRARCFDAHRPDSGLAYSRRHGDHFRAQHRAQSNAHGIDFPPGAALAS